MAWLTTRLSENKIVYNKNNKKSMLQNNTAAQSCNVGNFNYLDQLNYQPYWYYPYPYPQITNPQPWVTDFTITTTNVIPDALNKPIEVHICVNKERQKKHEGKVYLSDGSEFSIEAFNPNTYNVGMKVSMDGEYISDTLILIRAGQRLNLERHIDTNNKFLFTTYDVSNDVETKIAIVKNGQIVLEFYKVNSIKNEPKKKNFYRHLRNDNDFTRGISNYSDGKFNLSSQGMNFSSEVSLNNISTDSLGDVSCYYNSTMETGQIDKGSISSQTFQNIFAEFDTFPSQTIYVQILPKSQKPIEKTDLYKCGNCKTKYKKHDKFCSNCGAKL